MNRIFRIVWSRALQAWVVASELATRRGKGSTRAAVTLVALCLPAHAADRYWDANGTAVGSGGTGTWNTTGLFWSPNGDGVSGPYGAWNNAAIDNAIFGGTAGTVTLGTPITVHNLTFNAHNYVLTGNTLTLAGTTPTININSGAATIGSSIAGTAGVTKTGVGVLDVNGPASSDFVNVEVLAGTLHVGSGGSIQAAAGNTLDTVVANGATLQVDGHFGCGDANDTMDVAGTVTGTGTIDLCGGDDVLTLRDGAVLAAVVSGGTHGPGDTVVLDVATTLAFDAAQTVNFESLRKDNAGVATLTGTAIFSAGTTLNGGVLDIDGTLSTPTIALGDDTTLHVDGTLDAGAATTTTLTGSAGTNTVSVGAQGTLLANGDLGDGGDVLDVAGFLDTGAGSLALGAGDDLFTIHDDTDVVGIIEAGEGIDTFNADISGHAELGAVQDFETLRKSGVGVLDVNGPLPSDFDSIDVVGGTLHVAGTGSVSAMHTTVAAGATLDVQGVFTGTAGDDTFRAEGTVTGSLAFGAGNDDVAFVDADISDLIALDGGDGNDDRLVFDGMLINDADVPALSGWEQGELLGGSVLQLGGAMVLGTLSNPEASVLVIDPTSRLVVAAGAQVVASVRNEGAIDAGANRLAIGGDYIADGGGLNIDVSPANGASGGLDVAGDVRGTTAVAFTGDGTEAVGSSHSILVIASPNDDLATPADFSTDGVVRLAGSALPWTLAQAADRNWYLNAEADALLPEIGGYAVLSGIGRAALLENNRLLFQRMSAMREDTPRCEVDPKQERRAYWLLTGDCRGVWMAATASELEMGADPGFAFSGDTMGLFLGADVLLQDRGTRTLRSGVFVGFQRGNHWTTGANSTAQQGLAESNVRTDMPTVGFYQAIDWRSGTSLDVSLVAQRPEATVAVADGFRDIVPGSSLSLAARLGHRVALANGWQVEPQLQLDAIGMHWGRDEPLDASGRGVAMDDDVFATARAALRAGKAFETAGGARFRPWFTVGVQDTFGEKRDALAVVPGAGAQAQLFPDHALGLAATLDLGVEAELNAAVSLFGVLSIDESLEGTQAEQRQANVGVRVRW